MCKDFNDLVAIDFVERTDHKTNHKVLLLHMIDEFPRFSVVTVVESKKPVIIMDKIVIEWLMRFVTPINILHDLGGELNNDLILLLTSTFGCLVKTTGPIVY